MCKISRKCLCICNHAASAVWSGCAGGGANAVPWLVETEGMFRNAAAWTAAETCWNGQSWDVWMLLQSHWTVKGWLLLARLSQNADVFHGVLAFSHGAMAIWGLSHPEHVRKSETVLAKLSTPLLGSCELHLCFFWIQSPLLLPQPFLLSAKPSEPSLPPSQPFSWLSSPPFGPPPMPWSYAAECGAASQVLRHSLQQICTPQHHSLDLLHYRSSQT